MKITPEKQLLECVLTTEQVREVDQTAILQFGMHSLILMENAALGCVQWIVHRFPEPVKTVVLCGPGNNGGDGLVICRHLRNRGWNCQCFITGPETKFSSDAQHNFRILQAGNGKGVTVVPPEEGDSAKPSIFDAELLIDALLGTGASGNPRPPMSHWIDWANESEAFRLAIDLPTGVNADTGERGSPCFRADSTLTFVALKPSMISNQANLTYGTLRVLPIGIPEQQIRDLIEPRNTTS